MFETVPNRNSWPAVLLRGGWREGGRARKRTLANLTDWPAEKVQYLRPRPCLCPPSQHDSALRRTSHRNVPGAGNLQKLKNPNPNNQLNLVLPGEHRDGGPSWDQEAGP